MAGRFHLTWDAFATALGVVFAAALAVLMAVYAVREWNLVFALVGCAFFWIAYELSKNVVAASRFAPWQRLSIENGSMRFAGQQRLLSDVTTIRYALGYTKKSVNLIPSGTDVTGLLMLEFPDGCKWLFRSGVGVITVIDGNRGAEDTKMMVRVMLAISRATGVPAERIPSAQFATLV
jgi:hypothetical protein